MTPSGRFLRSASRDPSRDLRAARGALDVHRRDDARLVERQREARKLEERAVLRVRHGILHGLHSKHQNGTERTTIGSLAQCLKRMLSIAGQVPVYLILDALDECPADSGMPPPREKVLDLVEELVELRHPNLHLCITSRQEYDISTDIIDYVSFFVRSNKRMKKWSIEDQDMVIEKLAEKADGM
ncbi:hypothetical protein EDB84DRAFT_1573040 [Lactarius hengduanensis]|nr:hypothetical protein EDB84DRAFT_1573040 [Lactarius hengduanensis]